MMGVFLVGCNDSQYERTDIFALPYGSYGTVFMLAKGYSSNADKVILSLGEKGESHSYAQHSLGRTQYSIINSVRTIPKIEDLILEYRTQETSLYLSVVPILNEDYLSCEALSQLTHIYLVPEGTSIFEYPLNAMDKIISFKEKAEMCGEAKVKLVLARSQQ